MEHLSADSLLREYAECAEPERAERLLETLVVEHAQPGIRRIVRHELAFQGAAEAQDAEDVASEVLVELIARLRAMKLENGAAAIGAFSGYTAVAAYHACNEYVRRKYPNRRRLETRLRYLLGSDKDLAIWDAGNAVWLSGLARWRAASAAPATEEQIARWPESLGEIPRHAKGQHPADTVTLVLERLGAPVGLDELVQVMARVWGVEDAPPAAGRFDERAAARSEPPAGDQPAEIGAGATASAHLTEEQFARYRNRTLPPVELLAVDEHLSECPQCRDRAYAEHHVSNSMRELRMGLSKHLEYAGVVRCSEGSATPEQRAHLAECEACRAEVQDLSRFRTEMHDRQRHARPSRVMAMPLRTAARWKVPATIAAAVVLVAGGSIWMSRRQRPSAPPSTEVAGAEAPLSPADRALLERAVASNRFDRAPVLDHLIAKRGTLLSPTRSETTMELLSPVGTTVVRDRPELRWTPPVGARSYVVSIFDEHFNKVAESPSLKGVDWQPATPLPREKVLIWQVTATTSKGQVRAPRPPAPEARFEIVSAATAAHIEQMRQEHPGDPLLLAALYANAGALDAAAEALRAMDPAAAERYQESIAKIRRGE